MRALGWTTRPDPSPASTGTVLDADAGAGPPPSDGEPIAPARVGDRLDRADARRLRRAWAAGATLVLAAFTWLIMAGRWAPLQRLYFDGFFDAQGRAFLDGRWDVDPEVVGFEGFQVDGRTYIYFGPWPAVLRLPVLLVTDRLDGRLTTLSMILAMVVLAVASHRLNLAVRKIVRGTAPVSRAEAIATAGLAVAALSGPPLWLASQAVVFHEASIWGLAFMVGSMAALIQWIDRPTIGRLAGTGALAAGAVSSRFTLGLGLMTAMGTIVAVVVVRRWLARRRGEVASPLGGVRVRGLVAVCAALLVLAAIPNLARFGTLLSPPMNRQVATGMFDDRQEFLEANQGSFFGPQFLPTTAFTYLRPDGFDVRATFPWVDFPRAGPSVVNDPTFDDLVWTSSVPATMPAMAVLAIPGVGWIVAAVRQRRRGAWLGAIAVGAGMASAGVLGIGHISNRYLNDFVPVVLLLALIGAHALAGRVPTWRDRRRRIATGALAALVVLGTWGSLGLAVVHQRERGPVVPEEWREQLFQWRVDLPGARPPIVYVRDSPWAKLPDDAADGTVGVFGDCDGVYVRVGDEWRGVSRGPGAGVHEVRVDLDALADRPDWRRIPLVVFGEGSKAGIVALRELPDGRVRVDVDSARSVFWREGYPEALEGEVTIRIDLDPLVGGPTVTVGRTVLYDRYIAGRPTDLALGELPTNTSRPNLDDHYPGEVERLVRYDDALCRDLTDGRDLTDDD